MEKNKVKPNRLKLYISIMSLLRVRENRLTRQRDKNNNARFMEELKKNWTSMDVRLLNYMYTFLYLKLHFLDKSTITLDPESGKVRIQSLDETINGRKFEESTIEVIDDDVAPIKTKTSIVTVNRETLQAQLKSEIVYSSEIGIDLVQLMSDYSPKEKYEMGRVRSFLKRAENFPKNKILYRTESEIDTIYGLTNENGNLRVDTYYASTKRPTTLELAAEKEEDNKTATRRFFNLIQDTPLPYEIKDYFSEKQKESENREDKRNNEESIDSTNYLQLDPDLAEAIENMNDIISRGQEEGREIDDMFNDELIDHNHPKTR